MVQTVSDGPNDISEAASFHLLERSPLLPLPTYVLSVVRANWARDWWLFLVFVLHPAGDADVVGHWVDRKICSGYINLRGLAEVCLPRPWVRTKGLDLAGRLLSDGSTCRRNCERLNSLLVDERKFLHVELMVDPEQQGRDIATLSDAWRPLPIKNISAASSTAL